MEGEWERTDRPLFDKYCETRWRDGGVFIADININFPGAALLAQHGLSTGKLERKFSEPQGSGIKEPGLWDLWHTELLADPTALYLTHTHVTDTYKWAHVPKASKIDRGLKVRLAQTKQHVYTAFKTIWNQWSPFLVFSAWSSWRQGICFHHLISCVCQLCGSWGWRTLARIGAVRRSAVNQRFNEPYLRSLIKTWQTHTHTQISVCHTERICTRTHRHTSKHVWLEIMMM